MKYLEIRDEKAEFKETNICKDKYKKAVSTPGGKFAKEAFQVTRDGKGVMAMYRFTEAELEAAQVANGFDPEVAAMHTNCRLDPSSQPPAVIRFASCNQYYVDGTPTEEAGTPLWFYWKNYYDPAVSSVLIGSAAGSDAQ